jgi:hypothetical protein
MRVGGTAIPWPLPKDFVTLSQNLLSKFGANNARPGFLKTGRIFIGPCFPLAILIKVFRVSGALLFDSWKGSVMPPLSSLG